jgi:methyl-accepting chemotaxis protein
MSALETLGEAFEKVANFQNSISDAKAVVEKIGENNDIVGDVKDSIGSIEEIVKAVQTKDIASVISSGMDLGKELAKMPGDINKFIDEKGGSLLEDGSDLKDEVLGLITKIGDQFKEIVGDLKEGGIKGFIDAIVALTTAISEDIKSGQEISNTVEHMVDTLESKGSVAKGEVEIQTKAENIASGMKDVSDVKDAGGKDGQQSPATPGQDTGGQEMGM